MTNKAQQFSRRPRNGRCALLALPFLVCAPSLLAQSSVALQASQGQQSPQAAQSTATQVVLLANRVTILEQKLATLQKQVLNDEASGANSPATPVGAPDDPTAPGGGLSKADQNRLAAMQKQIDQLEEAQKDEQKDEELHPVPHPGPKGPTRVTAPFQVVDSNGVIIMEVLGNNEKDDNRGLTVNAMNGTFVQIGGGGAADNAGVRVFAGNMHVPTVVMGIHPDGRPGIAILGLGTTSAELTTNGGGGELQLSNPGGQVVSLIGSNPTNGEGHAVFTDSGGTPLVRIGAAGAHGDVLLGGPNKALAVWEMMLTGFH